MWKVRSTSVSNGEGALAAMERALTDGEPFGIALIDADMPGMSGSDLVEQIRKHAAHERTKLVLLVPTGVRADRYQPLGAAAHVRKPLTSSSLLDGLLTALGDTSASADLGRFAVRRGVEVSPNPLRILLAEDNLVNQKFAVLVLEKMGHRVVVVGNGREASRRFEAQPFDAILMDVQMPEMDGLEATAEIRALEAKNDLVPIPIIAMTAEALKGDRERCLNAGMDMYITKPFRIEELAIALARVMRREDDDEDDNGPITERSGMSIGAVLRTSPTPDTVTTGKSTTTRHSPSAEHDFDIETALTRAAGETDLLREVVIMMLHDTPGAVERLQQALVERDFERLRRLAHNLKGASSNLGCDRLARSLHSLEQAARTVRLDLAETAMAEAVVAWTAVERELSAWSSS
jgi:CheY-like chemotaxis protein